MDGLTVHIASHRVRGGLLCARTMTSPLTSLHTMRGAQTQMARLVLIFLLLSLGFNLRRLPSSSKKKPPKKNNKPPSLHLDPAGAQTSQTRPRVASCSHHTHQTSLPAVSPPPVDGTFCANVFEVHHEWRCRGCFVYSRGGRRRGRGRGGVYQREARQAASFH